MLGSEMSSTGVSGICQTAGCYSTLLLLSAVLEFLRAEHELYEKLHGASVDYPSESSRCF